MKDQKEYVKLLMDQLDYPENAQAVFLNALDRIAQNASAKAQFEALLAQYNESEHCPYLQMLEQMDELGESVGIHKHTAEMLMYLCFAKKLRERYAERGIDDSIYLNSMMDLRYKLEECRLVYGTVGSFVASWFRGFFDLSRFALGRLQFEIVESKEAYTVSGTLFPAGTKAINVHIPRTGTRLDHNQVLDAYRMAAEMFASVFKNQPIVFVCDSWLLDPWNLTVLSPTSNLAAFCTDFQLVKVSERKDYNDMWRLFDCLYTGDPSVLPRDSSFRRAYAQRLERGEPVAHGLGMFIYRDGMIVHE